ncbi:MAG: histidine ammonia-lyase [Planctomycetes bacterium]|nr:histidine ammonia-lyase [Planctomycetota bacterium]
MDLTPIILDGTRLTLEDALRVANGAGGAVRVADEARQRVRACRALVDDLVRKGDTVYGVTTGFGRLKDINIEPDDVRALQRNLLLSHAMGVGPDASAGVVRLLILYRLNTLLQGRSGVREETIDQLLGLLTRDALPVVPEQGSVGASGDLAPLSHLALVLIGEGEADVDGERVSGAEALKRSGLLPLELQAKEGLALINGTQFTAAVATVALGQAWTLAATADISCALTIEALMGSDAPFDERVGQLRAHPGHLEVATNVRRLLKGSDILPSHEGCGRVQDPYSLRCAAQVQGAVRDALRHLTGVLTREINAVTDNPLLFVEDGRVISAGNFHGEPLALPLDYCTIAVSELASISERRTENLVNPDLSHLPPFLAGGAPGVNSGLMIAQVLAAALVSENKVLSHPASVDSIPTSANQEDHVSMSPIAARQLDAVTVNATNVLAVELLCGFLGLHWRRPLRAGEGVEAAVDVIAEFVGPPGEDRAFGKDVRAVARLIGSGRIVRAVEASIGPMARGREDGAP